MWIRISKRRKRILLFLQSYLEEKEFSPTVREICSAVGISSTSVMNHNLARLEEGGLLRRKKNVIRGIYDIRIPEGEFVLSKYPQTEKLPSRKRHKTTMISACEYFQGKCAYCDRKDSPLERDHFYPLSKGGVDDITNIVPACKNCNKNKRDVDPVMWILEHHGKEVLSRVIRYLCSISPS